MTKRKRKVGVGQKGGKRWLYTLSDDDVREIWAALQAGVMTQRAIAEKFNCTQEQVSHIATGTRRNNITGLPRRTKASTSTPPSGQRRGRPRASRLRHRIKPTEWKELREGCIEALLREQVDITYNLSKALMLPVRFPAGKVLAHFPTYETRTVGARKMLTWLFNNGYSDCSANDITKAQSSLNSLLREIDRELGLD